VFSALAEPITVPNHSFEDNTSWIKAGDPNQVPPTLADKVPNNPDGTTMEGRSYSQPFMNAYQVLSAVVEAKATYTLTVDMGAMSGATKPFPVDAALHLGYVDASDPTTGAYAYGWNAHLLPATVISNAVPAAGEWRTWVSTFTVDSPTGLGRPLRIEIYGGTSGTATDFFFDNVRLDADIPPAGTVLVIR